MHPASIDPMNTQIRKGCRANGKVFLVGAGPGDPELLTVKALRVIGEADVVLYDNLVSQEIRDLIPASSAARYVGKSRGRHSLRQSQLNQTMAAYARKGEHVCRLKGGDPFIFGRGGEEMLALRKCGIDVEVVPGITAALGCSAHAGIPLTHRGISQAVTLITGQGAQALDVDWQALAGLRHTLVFYMGLASLQTIESELLGHGAAGHTPVALIERGTMADQRIVTGQLDQLSALSRWYQVASPALIVVGEVARMATDLHWFGELIPQEVEEMSA